ncbi:MAG: hypothetical protein J6T30_02610 [Bacteroidales bacterium]|nr:hypothetical protein [Bacteroidales bacterium]MBP5708199.1 hypothetical protein [Bacteroidales bacterium]
MTETKKSSNSMGLVAFIIAIVAFVMAIIPCVGIIAIIPCIIAIVIAAIGLPQANRTDSPRGMLISGLIIGIVALFISMTQIFIITKLVENSDNLGEGLEEIFEDLGLRMNDGVISISDDEDTIVVGIDSEGKPVVQITGEDGSVVISGRASSDKMMETLEELEAGDSSEPSATGSTSQQGSR